LKEDSKKIKPIVAICYDFDKTLSPTDMQNYSLIPSLGMTPDVFWKEATKLTDESQMDGILAYMYLVKKIAEKEGKRITREDLKSESSKIRLFEGVMDWFDAIEECAEKLDIIVEHYIISSGMKEMIEDLPIAKFFKKIYACEFIYSKEYGFPVWPKQVVNPSNKTQYLFRINKGCIDENDMNLNESIKSEDRRIPFCNILYIGDSMTDIPCMAVTKRYGGYSIGVYDPESGEEGKRNARKLINDSRVDYCVPADYRKDKELFKITEIILKNITVSCELAKISQIQKKAFNITDDYS
jgi:2-hydroxy-3-keto-5-methylthiopentenyl-1-phosphate phosphatase